jgi:hypothetical protein
MTNNGRTKATDFPYDGLPENFYWKDAFRDPAAADLDPQGRVKFRLTPESRIASAGSCFARRIAEDLRAFGFSYVVEEPGPSWLDEQTRRAYHYGLYSARYGDVLTALQFEQLLLRALGRFTPQDEYWAGRKGTFLDPFRPLIQPGGFASIDELVEDRRAHLEAVVRAVKGSDVFIFTLGLTEAWVDRRDGAVYPVPPGRGRGAFDPERVEFQNFSSEQTAQAIERAFALLREINPKVRLILTVSPVPLAATYAGPHVLRATVYSKSALRAAAETAYNAHDDVDYFASYEIATANGYRAPFFDETGRSVTEAGVATVMRSFFLNYFGLVREQLTPVAGPAPAEAETVEPCDEDAVLASVDEDLRSRT